MFERIYCDRCGKFGHPEVTFPKLKLPFRKLRTYCPECFNRLEDSVLIGIFALIPIIGLIGFFCLRSNPNSDIGHVYLNIFLVQVCVVPSVVIHEFAHALVGKAVGLGVSRIWIGRGKTLLRKKILGFDTEFKIIPFSGFAFLVPKEQKLLRSRFFLAVLAGPLANVIILILACRGVSWHSFDPEKALQLKPIILITQVFLVAECLLPFKVLTGMGIIRSDGRFLIDLISKKEPSHVHSCLLQSEYLC